MRARILEATIACLVEEGYQRTTISRVTERAGASRGAHQHHFSVKSELVISAVEYLAQERMREVRRLSRELATDSSASTWTKLDVFWSALSGPLYIAAAELWQAARTDEALREALIPAERRIGHALRDLARDLFDPDPEHALGWRLDLCFDTMRGLAIRRVLLGEAETEAAWRRYRPVIAELLTS
jgi:AcrR family transcriptional regulator